MASKFSDVAVGKLEEDRLGFGEYAEGVIATIENLDKEDTPFTIGIFGDWGSGKTSLMQIMQNLLKSRGYETIFFNSWAYGNEEKPWIPFMITVVDKLFEDEIDKKELIKNIFLFSTDVVLQNYSQGMILTGGILDKISTERIFSIFRKSKKKTPFKEWSDEDTRAVIERVSKIEDFKKKITKRAVQSQIVKPSIKKKINNFIDDLIKKLKNFKKRIIDRAEEPRTRDEAKGKIIIFIDDLDRMPEKLIDFLNSLKTFFDIQGCIFILGCNYEIMEGALKQKYKGEFYEDYFDKIVQTEFYIPKISEQSIKTYLENLLGSDKEIDEYTKLVNYSIGGNPRKIKRAVNATEIIKNVFQSKMTTILQEFEKPKTVIKPGKEEIEKHNVFNMGITRFFTPAQVFNILFDKKVLFKLVCMREQWSSRYKRILINEEMQEMISSKEEHIKPYLPELLNITKKTGEKLKETEKLPDFLECEPQFQGVEDIKTYLNLLDIASPEAGISLEYGEPAMLPINLFNRYMMFERIRKGKVEKTIIKEKIQEMDWESSLESYYFFEILLSYLGYHFLLDKITNVAKPEKIKASNDLGAINWLLNRVSSIDIDLAGQLIQETKDDLVEKIRNSDDLGAIGSLLDVLNWINKPTAVQFIEETKYTYAEKIRTSNDLGAIGSLLKGVKGIDKQTAAKLYKETKDDLVEKIRTSDDPVALWWLLDSVKWMDETTVVQLYKETKDDLVEKIRTTDDLYAIDVLLDSWNRINKITARQLLQETKDMFAEKIRTSDDLGAIGSLFHRVSSIGIDTTGQLIQKTKDDLVEKIRTSNDPGAIGSLLHSVKWVDKPTAVQFYKETKDDLVEKIRNSDDLGAIGSLLDVLNWIDKPTAVQFIEETKDIYAEKIRTSNDLYAIGSLVNNLKTIDKPTTVQFIEETINIYADKIRTSNDQHAIRNLVNNLETIDEATVAQLIKEKKDD